MSPKGWFAEIGKTINSPHSLPHLSNLACRILNLDRNTKKVPLQIAIGFVLEFRVVSFRET